jgi:hypothetical protein
MIVHELYYDTVLLANVTSDEEVRLHTTVVT